MAYLADDRLASGRGNLVERSQLAHLGVGRMVSLDLDAARERYERFFGMECVRLSPDRMIVRDRRAKYLMGQGERNFFLLDVRKVDRIELPQALVNHWGFSVKSEAEVDRVRAIAVDRAEQLGFKRVFPTTHMHGSYGFYVIDNDENWWEIEFRKGVTNDLMFSRGDWDAEGREDFPIVNPDLPIASTSSDVLGEEAFMTHGTTAVADCNKARPFYEDILRLRTVRHSRQAHCIGGGSDFGVVGVGAGDKIQDQVPDNRFILLTDNDDQLEEVYGRVKASAQDYGLLEIGDIHSNENGTNSFLLRTADQIWFEVSSTPVDYFHEVFQ